MEAEVESQINEILKGRVAKRQIPIAIEIVKRFKEGGCYARSGKQLYITDILGKIQAPKATIYRVVRALEKQGFVDRESRFSGYFLSFNFSNWQEEKAAIWRKFCKV